MGLVYLPTFSHFYMVNVSKYTSPMDAMGYKWTSGVITLLLTPLITSRGLPCNNCKASLPVMVNSFSIYSMHGIFAAHTNTHIWRKFMVDAGKHSMEHMGIFCLRIFCQWRPVVFEWERAAGP